MRATLIFGLGILAAYLISLLIQYVYTLGVEKGGEKNGRNKRKNNR